MLLHYCAAVHVPAPANLDGDVRSAPVECRMSNAMCVRSSVVILDAQISTESEKEGEGAGEGEREREGEGDGEGEYRRRRKTDRCRTLVMFLFLLWQGKQGRQGNATRIARVPAGSDAIEPDRRADTVSTAARTIELASTGSVLGAFCMCTPLNRASCKTKIKPNQN